MIDPLNQSSAQNFVDAVARAAIIMRCDGDDIVFVAANAPALEILAENNHIDEGEELQEGRSYQDYSYDDLKRAMEYCRDNGKGHSVDIGMRGEENRSGLRVEFFPLFGDEGGVTGLLCFADPVENENLLLDRLRSFSAHGDVFSDIAVGSFYEVDFITNKIWFSPHWLQILKREDCPNPMDLDEYLSIVAPESRDGVVQHMADHVEGKTEYYEYEPLLTRGDGSQIWGFSRGKVVAWQDNGEPSKFAGAIIDISDLQVAREAIRMREETLLDVLGKVSDATIVLSASGDVKFSNPAVEQIFGYRPEELEGVSIAHLLRTPDHDAFLFGLTGDGEDLFPESNDDETILQMVTKSGKYLFAALSVSNISSDLVEGGAVIVTVRDISARVRASDRLHRAKEAAERASRAKSDFLSLMSHELRTPLNGIRGMAELIGQLAGSDEEKERVGIISSSADMLLGIINQILDYSRLENDPDDDAIEFDIHSFAQEAMARYQTAAGEKGLKLSVNSLGAANERVSAHPERLEIVLRQLLGNAVKFTESGEISLDWQVSRNAGGDEVLEFIVRDTGIGIEEDKLKDIFEPFVQAQNTLTRSFEGTGLGLAIARRHIELMGGTIRARSSLGRGCRIEIEVPIQRPEGETRQESMNEFEGPRVSLGFAYDGYDQILVDGRPLRVLVAEDNGINRLVLAGMLEPFQYELVEAENGQEAVDLFGEHIGEDGNNHHFDLILMDVQMPVLDGEQATKAIRALETGNHQVPIVAITAHAMVGDKERYLQSGMTSYLSKPISSASLYEVIAECFDISKEEQRHTA